jgi:hypothetical protein
MRKQSQKDQSEEFEWSESEYSNAELNGGHLFFKKPRLDMGGEDDERHQKH